MSREKLVEGRDFESGWIEEVTFEPTGTGVTGMGSVVIKGTRYGYVMRAEAWETFKQEARKSLESENASAGSAYNKFIKHASINESHGLGPVKLPDEDDA